MHLHAAVSVLPPPAEDNRLINTLLLNGARFYVDHAHPEFSTPECLSASEVVAFDQAGELILNQCRERSNQQLKGWQQIQLFKNNSDHQGHSYGCHENYLLEAQAYQQIFQGRGERELIPFLISRPIFCGAGKVGVEEESDKGHIPYQISQRADFFETLYSVKTTSSRPLINTRDEPHADRERFRRLHLILGDANMSAYTAYLKIGTTQMVLRMFEDHAITTDLTLEDPVNAFKIISRDPSCRVTVRLRDGRRLSAVEIQEAYLELAHRYFASMATPSAEEADVLHQWTTVIHHLKTDPMALVRKIDWVIKKWLLEWQSARRGMAWGSSRLAQLDIQYHNIDRQKSLYYFLEQEGWVDRFFPSPTAVEQYTSRSPAHSRAYLRSQCLSRYSEQIQRVSWGGIWFNNATRSQYLALSDPTRGTQDECEALLKQATSLADLIALWSQIAKHGED
jgi:proteasome accessory factor A